MALNAQDVHDKQFKLVRQSTGYDIDEVDAFLDEVEAAITELVEQRDGARARADEAAASLERERAEAPVRPDTGVGDVDHGGVAGDAPSPETSLGVVAGDPAPSATTSAAAAARILELAQRTADEYTEEARRQADEYAAQVRQAAEEVLAQARATAEEQLAATETQRVQLEVRVSALRTFESQVRTRLTSFFEGQLQELRDALPDLPDLPDQGEASGTGPV